MTVKTKTTAPKLGNRKKSALLKATGATESALNSYLQGLPPGILKKCSALELAWIYNSTKPRSSNLQVASKLLAGRWKRLENFSPLRGEIFTRWMPQVKRWPVQALQTALLIVRRWK